METEFEETNKILKENKKLIIEKIKITTSFEEKEKLFKILSCIDEDIYRNLKRIEELNAAKNINKLENTISLKSNVINENILNENNSIINDNDIPEINDNPDNILIKDEDNLNFENDIDFFIGISKNENIYEDNEDKSYYNLSLKERIRKRIDEEKKKPNIKPKKRKYMYPKDD